MKRQGRIGQLFITGKEDIHEYIISNKNTVMIATNSDDKVIAATYITQNQNMFSYNDITKYFKVSPEYNEYIKEQYPNELEYKKDVLDAYEIKMQAYLYARDNILKKYPKYKNMDQFLKNELESENKFDEKSVLRQELVNNMAEYIKNEEAKGKTGITKKYEQFFWMTAKDVSSIIHGNDNSSIISNKNILEAENILQLQKEHQNIIENAKLVIYEPANFDQKKYFNANTENAIEIDTYITKPSKKNCI